MKDQHSKKDKLKIYLVQHTRALAEEASRSEGCIAEHKLQELERLARLVEIQKSTRPPAPKFRWPVIVLLATTLVIVSILFFARVRSTEIELDLSLSEINFRLTEPQLLTGEMKLSSLGVSGLDQIELPRFNTKEAQTLRAEGGVGSSIQLTSKVTTEEQGAGSVTLAAIALNNGAHIGIQPAEATGQHRIFIKSQKLELIAAVHGVVEIGRPGIPAEEANFPVPKSIVLQSGPEEIDLDINLVKGTKSKFSKQLLADSLSLFSVDKHINIRHTIVRHVSTILSGTMYFESLGGKEQRLRPGQELRFTSSTGQIRALELKDNHIAFAFHGRVKGMTTGTDQNRVSLMPTYLEWLKARHGLSLLWGSTLYFFGLIFGVIRWWRAS